MFVFYLVEIFPKVDTKLATADLFLGSSSGFVSLSLLMRCHTKSGGPLTVCKWGQMLL